MQPAGLCHCYAVPAHFLAADLLQALVGFLEAAHCKAAQSGVTLIEKDSFFRMVLAFGLWIPPKPCSWVKRWSTRRSPTQPHYGTVFDDPIGQPRPLSPTA